MGIGCALGRGNEGKNPGAEFRSLGLGVGSEYSWLAIRTRKGRWEELKGTLQFVTWKTRWKQERTDWEWKR